MPFNLAHNLFVMHGTLPGGESWSCGIRADLPAGNQAELDAMTLPVANAFRVFTNTLRATANSGWSPETLFDGVTGRVINPAGLTIIQSEQSPVTAIITGTSVGKLPNQCATVVTLLTGTPGRRGKGRVYLPLLALQVAATGRAAGITAVRDAFKTFLDTVNTSWTSTSPSGLSRWTVASQVAGSEQLSEIVAIRVGDVLDTQRRRRESMTEAYYAATLAA